MASFLSRQLRRAGKLARVATKIPGISSLARAIPGVGLAMGAFEIGSLAMGAVRGSGGSSSLGMPALGGGMALPGAPGSPDKMGKRSIFRDDPNVPDYLKQYAIDDRFLKTFHRAPKGFVVLRDSAGDVYALPKKIAQQHGQWKPAKKPPISVRDWSAMQRVKHTMKKLRMIETTGRQLARLAAPRGSGKNIGTTNYIVEKGPGDVIQFPKRRKAA